MAQYITAIEVSLSPSEEQEFLDNNYEKINVNINEGRCGNAVYLWYKIEQDAAPISRIQFSFNDAMCDGLAKAGYTQVNNSLIPEGNQYLWYFCGDTSNDTPIVELDITTSAGDEAAKMKVSWEKAGCNLSGVCGKWFYLWVKRAEQTYICEVTATDSFGSDEDHFKKGFIRIDETTNSCGCGPSSSTSNFIWYRQTKNVQLGLTDLQISTNDDEIKKYQQQHYKSVSVNLNEGTGGRVVYLWYKTEKGKSQVKSMLLLLRKSAIQTYEKHGIHVIHENINEGNDGPERYLCVFKSH